MKYVFMKNHQAIFRVKSMARVLRASRSGFYAWLARQREPSSRQQARQTRDAQVLAAFNRAKQRYGAPRLTLDLREAGFAWNRKTVADSLRRQGLKACAARHFKATTHSHHSLPVAPNLLNQCFDADIPNQKWVGDIRYMWTEEGWLYLAVIIDLYSRAVVGWSMSERMTAKLACDALEMALQRRKKSRDIIVHTEVVNIAHRITVIY